eukprot:Gb_09622 [translate_table: standard]
MASASASPLPASYSPHSASKSKHSKSHTKLVKTKQNPPIELPSTDQLVQLLGILVVAALVATSLSYIIHWSKWHFRPFCDSGGNLQMSSDSCIPCPKHGRCWGGNLECLPGFKKKGRSCKEDRELEKKTQKLADFIQGHACGLYAESLCNGAGVIWFPEDNLMIELNQPELRQRFSLSTDEVPLVKEKAMEIIRSLFEIKTTFNGFQEFKCPDWLAQQYKPFECRTREWISKHYLFLLVFSPMVLVFTKFFWRVYLQRRMITRAEHLYQQVCEALEEKAIAEMSKGEQGEPWVVASRLRDHLLLPRERKNSVLWKQFKLQRSM